MNEGFPTLAISSENFLHSGIVHLALLENPPRDRGHTVPGSGRTLPLHEISRFAPDAPALVKICDLHPSRLCLIIFPHSAPSHKAQPKLSMARFSGIEKAHGFLRRLVRCSQMVLRYFLSGIGTGISVPSLNWKVRSLSLPTIAISTVEFQRSGSNSIRMSPHCRSLSSQRRISFFLLCRAWILDSSRAICASSCWHSSCRAVIPLSILRLILHLMLVFLNVAL